MKCLLHTLNTRLGATALRKKVGCAGVSLEVILALNNSGRKM